VDAFRRGGLVGQAHPRSPSGLRSHGPRNESATPLVQPSSPDGSFIETGDGDKQYFQEIALGLSGIPGYTAPLNLLSDADTRATVHVRMNQPIANFPWNLTMDRVRLEYKDLAGEWHPLATDVELIQNCTGGHSTLTLTAKGVLPQGREVRVYISNTMEDLVGERLVTADTYLRFRVSAANGAAGAAMDVVDEVREGFFLGGASEGSLQDEDAVLEYPSATWGNGRLSANPNFSGTGGPNGDFDFHVPAGTTMIFDTTGQIIVGGPGGTPTHQVFVVNGVLDIRDLYVPASSSLVFRGPNGVKILASGEVRIDGTVSVDGLNAKSVFTLNTPTEPELGAVGNCGGGAGGVGSFVTTQVTPYGGNGFGAFGVPNAGGEGGQSSWSNNNGSSGVDRRAAGGGGGRFGGDQLIQWGEVECAEETGPGLDSESGFPGSPNGHSSQDSGVHPAYGGPGVVQLHVNSLTGPDNMHDIRYPGMGSQADLGSVIRPVPVGYDNQQGTWRDQLLPDLGPWSQAQSKWISIGVPQVAPGTTTPDLLRFVFEGTDPATGLVKTTAGIVDSLPAILTPSNLPESPGLPNLDGLDGIHFDPTNLPAYYQANPSALVGFMVERAGWLRKVETAQIRFNGTQFVLALTMGGAWPSPPVGGPVTLEPRYFRLAGALDHDAQLNELPAGMSVRVEFQAASAGADGDVDTATVLPSLGTWSTDVATLTNSASNGDLRYIRFRVTFDMEPQAGGTILEGSLYLDLLKLTFLF
jgi:hypothetical protein